MDPTSHTESRSIKKNASCERGGKNPRREIKESGAFKESNDTKEGPISRNVQENAKKIKGLYHPLTEQLLVLVEYIRIMDKKSSDNRQDEMNFIINSLRQIKRQCEIYLNFKNTWLGKNG